MSTTQTVSQPVRPVTMNSGMSIHNGSITYDHSCTKTALPRAMRRIRKFWPMAYSKLLSLDWQACSHVPYGATDGRRLLLSRDGVSNLMRTSNPVGYLAFLLVHESMHALLNHGTRLRKFTDHKTANIAADYVINKMIKEVNLKAMSEHKLTRPPFPFIAGVLFDEALTGDKSVEQLYQQLKYDNEQDDEGANPPDNTDVNVGPSDDEGGDSTDGGDSDEGDTDSENGDTDGGDTGTDAGDDEGGDSNDGGGDSDDGGNDGGSGSGYGGDDATTDDEIVGRKWVGSEDGEDVQAPEVDVADGETEEDVAREIEQENERIVLQDELNQSAGMGGSSGRREITEHLHNSPTQRWQDIIRDWMVARSSGGWTKPCNVPLLQSTGLIGAGRENKNIGTWVLVVDTSGSMGDSTLKNVMANIQDAIDTIKPRETVILPVDHEVHEPYVVQGTGAVPISLKGGGGTAFQPAFDWIEEHYPHAEGIVYLTDGDAYDFHEMEEPNIPVLWLTYWRSEESYPFGDAVTVELYE